MKPWSSVSKWDCRHIHESEAWTEVPQPFFRDVAYNLTHDLLKEYFKLWTAIDSIRPDLDESSEDTIVWTLESSGQYSSKSAYTIQFAGQVQSSFPALIWNAWAPPKCKFFLWLLLQNRLWTSARLQLRHWKNNYFCASLIFRMPLLPPGLATGGYLEWLPELAANILERSTWAWRLL